jgi:hypothetical protein
VKELRHPDSHFPADITAYDFSKGISNPAARTFKFGLNTKLAIATLRELADRLESGAYLLQGVESRQTAGMEDFAMSSLTVKYAERKELPPLDSVGIKES